MSDFILGILCGIGLTFALSAVGTVLVIQAFRVPDIRNGDDEEQAK